MHHDNWAKYYDLAYEAQFGRTYQTFTAKSLQVITTLLPGGAESAAILDIGAGTGRLSIPLAQAGHKVTAIDNSAPMLAELVAKAAAAGVPVQTHHGDAAAACVQGDFDLALCVFTTVNYLTDIARLRQLMLTMSQAVRERKGCCLLSFASSIQEFANHLNGQRGGQTAYGQIIRDINIVAVDGSTFTYSETGSGVLHGVPFNYGPDRFHLRQWSQTELEGAARAAGLKVDYDDSNDASRAMGGTGEKYWVMRPV